ncbi:hypothetical protein BC829DRAFT_276329 [Chytridium lagenaria]|nr:hypothetical protein BC829DRAFT_276329 [Chytridium lagenaria]
MESKVLTGGERDYSQDGSSWSSDHRRGSIPEHVNSHRRGSILEHVNDYRRGSIPEHISMTSFSSRPLRETPEPAVLRFDEGWSTSTYRMGSASTGTVFGRTEALHNHAGEKARPHPRALSRIATSTPDISRSELDLSKPSSTRARSPLLTALDPTEEEVSNAKRVELFGIPLLRLTQVNSYAVVRQTYKYHRQSHRQDKPKSFLAVASLIFDLRHYYNLLWSFVKSPSRIAIFMILDLLSDIIMSILYLIEIQWNFSHHMDTEVLERGHPRWLWVSRPNALFYIASVFSIFNLLSFLNRLLLADHKLNTIFSQYYY